MLRIRLPAAQVAKKDTSVHVMPMGNKEASVQIALAIWRWFCIKGISKNRSHPNKRKLLSGQGRPLKAWSQSNRKGLTQSRQKILMSKGGFCREAHTALINL